MTSGGARGAAASGGRAVLERGLRLTRLRLAGEEYTVLSFELLPECTADAQLTAAERDVLALLASGASNADIARARRRAPGTIAKQISSIYRKLNVGSRRELEAHLMRARR